MMSQWSEHESAIYSTSVLLDPVEEGDIQNVSLAVRIGYDQRQAG
jgi:hypothetical protein